MSGAKPPYLICSTACAHGPRAIATVPDAAQAPSAASLTKDERLDLVRDPKVPKRWLVVGAVSRRVIASYDTVPDARAFSLALQTLGVKPTTSAP